MIQYPSEIAYDFRRFFGISPWDKSVSDEEFIHLIDALLRENNSRFLTEIYGRIAPFENGDVASWMSIDLFIQANTDPKKSKFKPTEKPWDKIKDTELKPVQDGKKMSVSKFERMQEAKKNLYKPKIEEEIDLFSDEDSNNPIQEEGAIETHWKEE